MPQQPGSTLEVPDGVHDSQKLLSLKGLCGTAERPITLRAQHRGKAVITGVAGLVLKDCDHVVIEGFIFENDADQPCVLLENCRHARVTRNVFQPKERTKPRHWEHWVTVEGAHSEHNRIDHKCFERKVNRGSPVFIRGDDTALVCSQHDQIDHNLLERCSGEDEIMSLKSSDNIVRGNTLINCRGAICTAITTSPMMQALNPISPGPLGFIGSRLCPPSQCLAFSQRPTLALRRIEKTELRCVGTHLKASEDKVPPPSAHQ